MALTIGTITNISKTGSAVRFAVSVPITASAVAATTVTPLTGAVAGLTTDMILTVKGPSPAVNCCIVGARCSAANVLQLDYLNPTDASVTPDAGTIVIVAE